MSLEQKEVIKTPSFQPLPLVLGKVTELMWADACTEGTVACSGLGHVPVLACSSDSGGFKCPFVPFCTFWIFCSAHIFVKTVWEYLEVYLVELDHSPCGYELRCAESEKDKLQDSLESPTRDHPHSADCNSSRPQPVSRPVMSIAYPCRSCLLAHLLLLREPAEGRWLELCIECSQVPSTCNSGNAT